jgi:hypothetical protein
VTLIVATAVTRTAAAAMADAAALVLLLLLGASDRADDDDATHPMVVFLLFPLFRDRRSWTTDDGRLSEEGEEEARGKKKDPGPRSGVALLQLLKQLWALLRNGLRCRAMLQLQGVYIIRGERSEFKGSKGEALGLRVCFF